MNDCKGCNLNGNLEPDFICPTGRRPEFLNISDESIKCPCSMCYLKMMCTKACKSYDEFCNEFTKSFLKSGE